MKRLNLFSCCLGVICLAASGLQAQTAKGTVNLSVAYFNNNARVQYVKANAKTKVNGRFQAVPGIPIRFYIGNDSPSHLLGTAVTNGKGEAVAFIPSSAKAAWMESAQQSFLAISDSTNLFEPSKGSSDVTKARISLDTAEDRKITATLFENKNGTWSPVKGVDIKIAVKRLGGDLNVNETPSFTTDSTGSVTAEFKREGLPADSGTSLMLVAKVEDNDTYGNLTVEKAVPWGQHYDYVSSFDRRSLFARRGHSPFWLEFMGYGIGVSVWFVLLYLALQIRKLQRLGKQVPA